MEKNLVFMISYFVIILIIIYFLVVVPNKKKHLRQKEMHEKLKEGDKVVTLGGITGKVAAREGEYIDLLVDEKTGTKLRIIVYAVSRVMSEN